MPCTSNNNGQQISCGCNCNNKTGTMPAGTAFSSGCGRPADSGMMPVRSVMSPRNLELATSYVVPQVYTESYTPEQALAQGTCFPELDMPYE
jgi:hypothetical protein